MQFFKDNLLISFDEFSVTFPEEANILKDFQAVDCEFEIQENFLTLRSQYSNPVYIDAASKLDYHKKFFYKNSIYKEPLAKALGLKKGITRPCVLDATAGFLGDTLLMLAMGIKVVAIERHPIAAALIVNSLRCIKLRNLPLEFYFEDAKSLSLSNLSSKCDVIYYDPMYTQKNQKTLPKKQMRIFRELIGVDHDCHETAKKLLKKSRRLVIKRSIKAQPILPVPTMSITGKSTCYDVYL